MKYTINCRTCGKRVEFADTTILRKYCDQCSPNHIRENSRGKIVDSICKKCNKKFRSPLKLDGKGPRRKLCDRHRLRIPVAVIYAKRRAAAIKRHGEAYVIHKHKLRQERKRRIWLEKQGYSKRRAAEVAKHGETSGVPQDHVFRYEPLRPTNEFDDVQLTQTMEIEK